MTTTEDELPPAIRAGMLVGALLCGLLLVLPTYGALHADSQGALVAWGLAGIAGAGVFGVLLRLLVPYAVGLALATAAIFLPVAVCGVWVMVLVGDPPGDGALALLVGLGAAAAAAAGAAAFTSQAREAAATLAGFACFFSLVVAAALGAPAGEALAEARDDAELVAELEDSLLSPYLPPIGDLEPQYGSTSHREGELVGYSLRYAADPDDWDGPRIYVEAMSEVPTHQTCDRDGVYECTEGEGYYLLRSEDSVRYVVASHGSTHLIASLDEETAELAEPSEIGEALAGAESVDWHDVIDAE